MRPQLWVNAGLLALALGTLGVVWATRDAPTTSELTARKDKLLSSFRKDDVSRIALTRDGRELVLERAGDAQPSGDFRIVKPWPERADIGSVNQLLGSLDLASALRSADGISDAQAGLGPHALQIKLQMPSKAAILTLGGPAPTPAGARYADVSSDGVTKRFVVSQGVATELDQPFDKFREPLLLEYGRRELSRITSGRALATVQLDFTEHDVFYTLQSGEHGLANRNATERVLTALSRLRTEQFVEAEEARQALANGAEVVALELADKSVAPVALTFGKQCPKAPSLALLLREQSGRPARAGCVPQDVADALVVRVDDVRLQGPFSARADEIEELRVTRGSQKLELARKDSGFVLRAPGTGEVPLDAGNQRISAIVDARGERADDPASAALNLQPPAGEITIQVTGRDEGGHRSEKSVLGRPRHDGSVCLRREADHVVLCFDAATARVFEPDATLLRSLQLLAFAASELAAFSVEGPDLRERVLRHDDGSYELEAPKGFLHDGALVADAVQTLGALQAARWVAPTDDNPGFGLAAPRLRVTVTLKSGAAARELSIGSATEGGFFARLTPDPGVFVLPRSAFSDLSTPLIDRALCPLAKAQLARIDLKMPTHAVSLQRQGEAWKSDLAAARAAELAETLVALRADSAVHLGAARANEGFAKPTLTVTFTASDEHSVRLLVGAKDTLDDAPIAYARLDGVDATFALSERTVQSLRDF